jgi:DNA-binding NarL/FixJ family response regulator
MEAGVMPDARSDGDNDQQLVTVMVVEDQDLVGDALRQALDGEDDFRVVAVVGSVHAALQTARELHPAVVVMDYGLPDGTGAEATTQLKAEQPEIEVVMLTGLSGGATLAEALEAGCSGFVTKEARYTELVTAIRGVVAGQVQVPPELMTDLVAHLRPHPGALGSDLTAREREVLQLLATGRSTDEMTEQLFLSIHTVRNHIRNILIKLNARSRLEAVAVATRLGVITRSAD